MSLAAQIAERHRRFHAHIAQKASELTQRLRPAVRATVVAPRRDDLVKRANSFSTEELEFHHRQMWFYDLVFPAPAVRRVDIRLIQAVVCEFYGIGMADLLCSRRTADLVRPRQIAMHLCHRMTTRSYPEIGRRFGGRDHTTALYADRKIGQSAKMDQKLASELETLEIKIRGTK